MAGALDKIKSMFQSIDNAYDNTIQSILDYLESNSSLKSIKDFYDNNSTIQYIMNNKYLKYLPLLIFLIIIILFIFLVLKLIKKIRKKKKIKLPMKLPVDLELSYNKQLYDSSNNNLEYFKKYTLLENYEGISNNNLYYNKNDSRSMFRHKDNLYLNLKSYT